ncbi:MAG: carboxypeptidase regulatory-like domain-containing protein [Planctomycetes bacterium]|nr:carboxypeptidase regulatory-like domain-containing protein [Planctomycetota bacterium]
MRSGTDRVMLIIAILVVSGLGVTVASIFAGGESTAIGESTRLEEVESTTTGGARRAPGPGRRPEETPVATTEVVEKRPVLMAREGEGLIEGRVHDRDDQAIAEARVDLELYFEQGELNYGLLDEFTATVTTDEEGRFAVAVPLEGRYRIQVRHDLFAPSHRESLQAGDEVEIELGPAAGLVGHVRSSQGPAIAGARLRLRQEKGNWRLEATTDESGRFGLPGLPAGKVVVAIEAAEYMPLEDTVVELVAGEVLDRDFDLQPGRAIIGSVIDQDGVRVPGVQIRCGQITAVADDIGRFRISGLARSSHSVEFIAAGFLTYWQEVNLSGSRETAEIEVKLSRGGKVQGLVVDDTGKPVADAEVKVFNSWGGGEHMWDSGQTRFVTRSDAQGQFMIDGLAAERWSNFRARAAKEGFANGYSESFKITDMEKVPQLTIIIRPGGRISGQVRNEDGQALAGVKVMLNDNRVYEWNSSGNQRGNSTLSDAEGRYAFDRLSEGQYRVSAMARGHATVFKGNIAVVGAGHSEGNDLVLKKGGTVKGSVKTPEGQPIADAMIQLNSRSSWGTAKTDEKGEYLVNNVGEGPYWMSAAASGYSRERKNEVFPVAERIDFELRRDGYVWGRAVTGEAKEPVRQFRVELLKQDARGGSSNWHRVSQQHVNDPEGKFKIYAPDGSYRLAIIAQGFIRKEIDNVALSVDADPEERLVSLVSGGSVEGWVRDDEGRPVSWVQVYHRREGDEYFRSVGNTEADGYYYVDSLAAGSYEIAFERRGFMPLSIHPYINVYGGEIARLDHVLRDRTNLVFRDESDPSDNKAPRWMAIKVGRSDGRPLTLSNQRWTQEGAESRPSRLIGYNLSRGQTTGARELAPGDYEIEISAKGFVTRKEYVTLRAGDDVEFPVHLVREEKK